MRRHPTTTFLMVLAIAAFSGALLRAVAPGSQEAAAKTPNAARIARGAHLVRTMGCNDCHTPLKIGPRGPEPDVSRALTGHPEDVKLPPPPRCHRPLDRRHRRPGPLRRTGASTHRGLTPSETGLGKWTEDMFIATMRTGRHEQGRTILADKYPILAAGDRGHQSVFAYLSHTPVKNRVAPVDRREAVKLAGLRGCDRARRYLGRGRCAAVQSRARRLASRDRSSAAGVRRCRSGNRAFSPQYPLWSDGAVKRGGSICRRTGHRHDGSASGSSPSARASGKIHLQRPQGETRFLGAARPLGFRDIRLE